MFSRTRKKKRKYSAVVEERCATFTPFVVSVDRVLVMQHLMKRLDDQIALKWTFCSNGDGLVPDGSLLFLHLLAWVQGQMEKWTWHG